MKMSMFFVLLFVVSTASADPLETYSQKFSPFHNDEIIKVEFDYDATFSKLISFKKTLSSGRDGNGMCLFEGCRDVINTVGSAVVGEASIRIFSGVDEKVGQVSELVTVHSNIAEYVNTQNPQSLVIAEPVTFQTSVHDPIDIRVQLSSGIYNIRFYIQGDGFRFVANPDLTMNIVSHKITGLYWTLSKMGKDSGIVLEDGKVTF